MLNSTHGYFRSTGSSFHKVFHACVQNLTQNKFFLLHEGIVRATTLPVSLHPSAPNSQTDETHRRFCSNSQPFDPRIFPVLHSLLPTSMPETYDGPFSLLQMFWGNLVARPLRCVLSILAIAIQVVLVLMIVGMTSGVISEWGKRVEERGRRHPCPTAQLLHFLRLLQCCHAGIPGRPDWKASRRR